MKFFEDFELNEMHYSERDYELTKQEIIEFSGQWDPMPFHLDEEVARQSYVGKLFTSSIHTVAIGMKLAHSIKRDEAAVVAGLGWDEVRFHQPVCVGDRLRVKAYVASKRESASKPDRGIVTTQMELYNQDDVMVASYKLLSMVMKKPWFDWRC